MQIRNHTPKGAVVIATFRRPELLRRVLDSIYTAKASEGIFKVIVFQGDDKKTLEIIEEYRNEETTLIRVSGNDKSPLENITHNYLLGLSIAFESLGADYAIEIEDDSLIADVTFLFINQIYHQYRNQRKFRGINLGSHEVKSDFTGTYSLLRSGFHASHGVITLKSWKFISKPRVIKRIRKNPLDATVEAYWKTGFSVTPNLSLCENFGWLKGTHASQDASDSHYRRISASLRAGTDGNRWVRKDIFHSWEPSPRKYKKSQDLYHFYKYLADELNKTALGTKWEICLKKFKAKLKPYLKRL